MAGGDRSRGPGGGGRWQAAAGLLTARALADCADEVVVLERERLPDTVTPRGRVPQGRHLHLHLLLSAGLDLLREWFPGVEDEELVGLGAVRVDGTGAWVHQGRRLPCARGLGSSSDLADPAAARARRARPGRGTSPGSRSRTA